MAHRAVCNQHGDGHGWYTGLYTGLYRARTKDSIGAIARSTVIWL